jgi:nucleotide-binding universal stress UspA family protein
VSRIKREGWILFKKILFCTDFSEDAHWAFTYALHLAKNFKSKLLILHVTPEPVHPEQLSIYLPQEKLEELRISQKKEIDQQLKNHYLKKMKEFKTYKIVLKEGEPFVEIIKMAKKESVHLIVMGTHGRTGLDHILFGSTAEKVVRKSPCPVLTIRLPGKKFKML